jgi:hypothetical protein
MLHGRLLLLFFVFVQIRMGYALDMLPLDLQGADPMRMLAMQPWSIK